MFDCLRALSSAFRLGTTSLLLVLAILGYLSSLFSALDVASSASAVSSSLVLVFPAFQGLHQQAQNIQQYRLYIEVLPAEATPTASRPSGLVEIATVKAPIAGYRPIRTGNFAVINAVATIPTNLAR